MAVKQTLSGLWDTIAAPVYLDELRQLAIGILDASESVLHPSIGEFLLQLLEPSTPCSLDLEVVGPFLVREHDPVDST